MEPESIRHPEISSERSAAFVLLMSLVTCGLYLCYWYYEIYNDLKELHGTTPTGNDYFLDFLLVIVTCGLWGVYVDYAISDKLNAIQDNAGMPANDTTTLAIILDVMAFAVGLTNLITSMIHQDQVNKIHAHLAATGLQPVTNKQDFTSTHPPAFPTPEKSDFGPGSIQKPGNDPNPYD